MKRWLKQGNLKNKNTSTSAPTAENNPAEDISEEPQPSTFKKSDHSKLKRPTNESTLCIKKRKYDISYLSYGFTGIGNKDTPKAQCVICNKILSNTSLAPTKLKRHLVTIHIDYKDKPLDFFKRKLEELEKTKLSMQKIVKTNNEKANEASYKVSYRIALAGKQHTIAETLIMPCVKDIVLCMFEDEKSVEKIDMVPLSNNTVARRIQDLADDIEKELVSRLHLCDAYSLQLDESTDVAGLAVLLVFVRYKFGNSIEEDLLLCNFLETNTTGKEIFNSINNFMKKHDINWHKCIDVCSDGAKSMVGKTAGVISRIKNIVPNCSSSHCVLHRHALVCKKISIDMKTVLDEAVQIVNFIKARPLQSRLFKIICEEMGSQHTVLLLHAEVRWLSRGKVLSRVFEMRRELAMFLSEQNHERLAVLTNSCWLMRLAYITDIFSKLNEVSLSLQGKSVTVFSVKHKISALSQKLKFWINCVETNNVSCFPTLSDFLMENDCLLDEDISLDIVQHLRGLYDNLQKYFPASNNEFMWVENPFIINEKPDCLSISEYENLIEIKCDEQLKYIFNTVHLATFWGNLISEYKVLAERAIRVLLPFSTTYLCEIGFSYYTSTKTKYRNRLNCSADMRIQLSTIQPDIARICKEKKQQHCSH